MNPKILIPLILVSLSSIIFSGCSGSGDVASLIDKAEVHIEDGNLGAAEIVLKNALREDQKNAQALAMMGQIYTLQGRLRDAYQILSAVKKLNPNDAQSLASLASIELAAGLRDEALADARKALELDPSHTQAPILLAELASSPESAQQTKEWLQSLPPTPSIYAAIGSLEMKSRNVAAASEQFEKAIELDPNSAMGYAGRFQILLAQKKQEEAMAAFAKAAEVADVRSGIRVRYIQYLQQSQGDDAAKAAIDEILEKAPDYLPALSLAAELAAKMNKPEDAKKLVDRALKLDPIDPTAMRVRGTLLVLDQKIDEAIAQLEKALELYPNDIKANYQVALAYLAKRDLGKAKSRLTRVVAAAPAHLEANALLSTIQVQEEDYSGAIITLEKFLKQSPNSIQGYLLLAEVYNRKGDSAAAVSIYKKLEEAQPENPQLDYLSGLSYLQGQDRGGARSAFEAALANNPLHLQSVEQLTALDMGERNFDSALERINQTIAASPDTSVLYTIRAQILQSKGDTDGAIQSFEKSIELDTNNRTARTLYARLLRSLGDTDEAFAQSQAILESNPDDLGAMTTIASIHESQERFKEAVEVYEKMLTVNDSYLPALNNLAYLYSTKFEKSDRAFELAQKAREQAPTSPYTADTLGWIVYNRGDYSWARSLLSESYATLSANNEVAYHLGSTYYMLGDLKQAQDLLKQATSTDLKYSGIEDAVFKKKVLSIDHRKMSDSDKKFLVNSLKNNPNDPMLLVKLGQILEQEGSDDEAIANYRKALKVATSNLQAQLRLGYTLLRKGNLEEAQSLLKSAVSQNPKNADLSYLQGKVALASGNYEWALSLLKGSYAADSTNTEIAYDLGSTYYSLGRKTDAISLLNKSTLINTEAERNESAQEKINILQTNTTNYSASSVAALETYITNNPNDAQAIATLATLQLRNGDTSKAEKTFNKALALSPENVFAKLGLAEILSEDPANAARIYTMASEAREHSSEANRARALQGISLSQQGKTELAKTQLKAVKLDELPTHLRERVARLMEEEK